MQVAVRQTCFIEQFLVCGDTERRSDGKLPRERAAAYRTSQPPVLPVPLNIKGLDETSLMRQGAYLSCTWQLDNPARKSHNFLAANASRTGYFTTVQGYLVANVQVINDLEGIESELASQKQCLLVDSFEAFSV